MSHFHNQQKVVLIKIGLMINSPESSGAKTYEGNGRITGLVRESGTPVRRRVNLHARPKGTMVASTWSGVDGVYTFRNIAEQYKYYIVCLDETGEGVQYPALVNDLVAGNFDEQQAAVAP